MVQNPPCWRASSLLFPHWDIKIKRPEPVKLDLPFAESYLEAFSTSAFLCDIFYGNFNFSGEIEANGGKMKMPPRNLKRKKVTNG